MTNPIPTADGKTPEAISQAAILRDDVIWTLPRPARHHNIFRAMYDVDNGGNPDQRPTIIPARGVQGFITNDGEFLLRIEAAKRAERCGQLKTPLQAPPQLFSEDLW